MENNNSTNNVINLNVGGSFYSTTEKTLSVHKNSYLADIINENGYKFTRDMDGRIFIDRDGELFRFILDFCRYGVESIPKRFSEITRLRAEADFYRLDELVTHLDQILCPKMNLLQTPSCIIIGYRGSFACGREGISDLRFRKIARILVHGQTAACKQIFGDFLNDTRDPDIGSPYSCRFFLNNNNLEQAFDMLYRSGYRLITSCASGANTGQLGAETMYAIENEELRWQHYNEFVFVNSPLY